MIRGSDSAISSKLQSVPCSIRKDHSGISETPYGPKPALTVPKAV